MKLKQLVGLSLILYASSMVTLMIVGFWVAPNGQVNGLRVNTAIATQPESVGGSTAPTTISNGKKNSAKSESDAKKSSGTSSPSTTSSSSSGGGTSSSSTTGGSSGGSSGSSGGSSPPPPSSPPPAPSCGQAGGSCTSTQVAGHSTQTDCWVIYNGGYYIVTSYVNQHPGGKSVFNSSTCGHDITGYLNGTQSTAGKQKKHGSTAYSILNSYYVGPVS